MSVPGSPLTERGQPATDNRRQGSALRILLIDPPFYRFMGFYNRYFPIGLVSLGTVLRNAGHEVFVCDADFNERPTLIDYTRLPAHYGNYLAALEQPDHPILTELRETIRRVNPDLTGISIWTTFAASALRVAEICKEVFPARPIVLGGPHATAKADELLRVAPAVNYVVRGEGENTLVELIKAIADSTRDTNPKSEIRHLQLESIPGLSFRDGTVLRHNPPREQVRDLDEFPIPDRELLMHHDRYTPEDMGLIMTSRGCPYSCSYCATETRRVSYRSVDSVVQEIKAVQSRYGTVQFSFKDDSFTVNRARVEELCDRIGAERLRLRWDCTTRANLVTEDLLHRMKRAGCNGIKIGIESGSERILQQMNKGLTLGQMREAARLFRRTGIYWTGYFMLGVPGETVAEIHQTRAFMEELRPDHASVGAYEPYPGTAMFQEGLQRGLFKADMTYRDFFTTLPHHYYKLDPRRQVETIEPEQFMLLEQEMKAAFHAHNRQYRRILSRARTRTAQYLRSPRVLYDDWQKYWSWRNRLS